MWGSQKAKSGPFVVVTAGEGALLALGGLSPQVLLSPTQPGQLPTRSCHVPTDSHRAGERPGWMLMEEAQAQVPSAETRAASACCVPLGDPRTWFELPKVQSKCVHIWRMVVTQPVCGLGAGWGAGLWGAGHPALGGFPLGPQACGL